MSTAGDLIGDRYRLVRLVGSGGMGTVWEATDERLHRSVAIKQLRAHPELSPAEADLANQRAMREARITARLQHRHAVPVFDVVEHEGRPCLVMQFLPSMTLAAVLKEGGPLAPTEAALVGAQIASALAAAHAVGIVHRDVKPSNILVADDGNALISDFGISRALGDSSLTATGLVHGTPAYLAPEVARGADSSFASDVFSLGSTLYATLEGQPPFGSDPNAMALLYRVAAGDISPLQHTGPLADTVMAMLAFDPADRPSMPAVAEMLRALANPSPAPDLAPAPKPEPPTRVLPTPAPPAPVLPSPATQPAVETTVPRPVDPGSVARSETPPGRRRGVLVAVLLLVVALIAVTVWGLSNRSGPVVTNPSAPVSSAGPATSAAATPSASSSAQPSTTPTPAPPPSSASASPSAPTSSASPTPTPTAAEGTPSAAELAGAITSYYSLVPDDLDESWRRLTPAYQANPSGGRRSYERFWGDIDRVSVSRVTGNPPNAAEATVTYVYKSGNRRVVERTAYGLVDDDGVLKINSSRVLG